MICVSSGDTDLLVICHRGLLFKPRMTLKSRMRKKYVLALLLTLVLYFWTSANHKGHIIQ